MGSQLLTSQHSQSLEGRCSFCRAKCKQLNVNAGGEPAPLSVYRDTTCGRQWHLPWPPLLASVNVDVATVQALSEQLNASARRRACRCGVVFG